MSIINFNLAPKESEKTEEWIKQTVRYIGQRTLTEIAGRKKDLVCHMYYNGVKDEAEFEYLNSVGDYVYPAKVRFFPIIRPKIDLQISKLTRRAISFRAFASDEISLKERYNKKMQEYFSVMDTKIKVSREAAKARIQELEVRIEQINQALQQQPESEEEAQMQQELKKMKPLLMEAIIQAKTIDEDFLLVSEEEEENIERLFKYKYEDVIEKGAQSFLKKSIRENGILEESLQAFKNNVITGKPIYFVDPVEGARFPDFKSLPSISVCWSAEESSRYIQDCPWASYSVLMGIGSVITAFPELTETDVERLEQLGNLATTNSLYTNFDHSAVFGDHSKDSVNYSGTSMEKLVDVTYVYYRSPRKVMRKLVPNKYIEGTFFSHIVGEEDLEKKPLREGEKLEIRFIDDIYEGVLIGKGDGISVKCRLKNYQVYDIDTLATQLPIVGYTFNSLVDEPYSYVWATKDIQDLYNILRYQEELLIVLSGVKGFVMDKSQKPDDMSYDEWMYNRKMGVAWIDTMKRKFGRTPTFNQFQSYDDTLTQSIIYIEEVLARLDESAGTTIGIPRQAVGQTVSTDQVGTNKQAVERSELINELMFYKHFELLGHALSRYMNCARDQGLNEEIISFVTNDMAIEDAVIPKGLFDSRRIDIYVTNSTKEFEGIQRLQEIAVQERGLGTIDLAGLVRVFNVDTLKEIEVALQQASEIAFKRQQSLQQSDQQFQAQNEQAIRQMEQQQEQMKLQLEGKLKQLDLQLKKEELQAEMAQKAVENQLKDKELTLKAEEASSKLAADAFEKQNKAVNDQFANKLVALKNQVDALLGSRDLDIKEKELVIKARAASNKNTN